MPAMRRDSAIEGIEGEVGEDLAGDDAIYSLRSGDAPEGDEIEQTFGRCAERDQSRLVQRIRHAETFEGTAQGITQRTGETHAGLRVVLQILQDSARQVQSLAAENGKPARLVIADLVAEHGETELQRAVKHVRLGEAKHRAPRQVSKVELDLQGLAASQEVVCGIVQSHEGAFETADAAIESNAFLAFFFDFQRQVHLTIFFVQLLVGDVRIVRLELVEIGKLIQAQQAQFPQTRVVHAALFERQFAPDHFVARGGIADELNAAHVELLAFVNVDFQRCEFLVVVKSGGGNARVVDVPILAVGFAQGFQSFGDFVAAENISVLEREQRTQRSRIGNRLIVLEGDLAQTVLIPFFDGHRNINRLAGSRLQDRNVEAFMSGVVDLRLGIADPGFEVAAVLILGPHPLGVFFKLGGVVGLGEDILQEDGMRNANGLQVLHRRPQNSRLDGLIAFELNFADLDLGPFLDHKCDTDRSGRNLAHFGADRSEEASMLREQILDRDFRLLDARGIVLAFDHQADFILLEAVQHITVGNRVEANVVDFADGWLFLPLDDDSPSFGSLFAKELDVFEVARIPQRIEIAFQRSGIVDVSRLGEDARPDGVGGNAPVAGWNNLRNHVRLRPSQACGCQYERDQHAAEPGHTPPHSWPKPLK